MTQAAHQSRFPYPTSPPAASTAPRHRNRYQPTTRTSSGLAEGATNTQALRPPSPRTNIKTFPARRTWTWLHIVTTPKHPRGRLRGLFACPCTMDNGCRLGRPRPYIIILHSNLMYIFMTIQYFGPRSNAHCSFFLTLRVKGEIFLCRGSPCVQPLRGQQPIAMRLSEPIFTRFG